MKKLLSALISSSILLACLVGCQAETIETTTTQTENTETTQTSEPGAKPENYPDGDINFIVPANAGSLLDGVIRIYTEYMDFAGEDVIITNNGGASQTIGTSAGAAADPDGQTILVTGASGLFLMPIQQGGLGYTVDDFRYVSVVQSAPASVVVATPQSGYESWEDVVAAAKAGEEITYSTGNAGNQSHLAMIALLEAEGIDLKFIPYSAGSTDVDAALQGGHLDLAVVIDNANREKMADGRLVPLVFVNDEVQEEYPEVPIYPDFELQAEVFNTYNVVCVPKDTPDDVYNYIKVVIDEAGRNPEYVENRVAAGLNAPPEFTEEELTELMHTTYNTFKEICDAQGLSAQ